MANTSIYNAFERMWSHITNALNNKANVIHNHNDEYYTETEVDNIVTSHTEDFTIHVSENDKLILNSNLCTANEVSSVSVYTVTINCAQGYTATNTNTIVLGGSIYNNTIATGFLTLSSSTIYMDGNRVSDLYITRNDYNQITIHDLEVTGDIEINIYTSAAEPT